MGECVIRTSIITCSIVILMCAAACSLLFAQGVATHNAAPKGGTNKSGKPFPVTFADVAGSAGLTTRFVSGGEQSKRYIIEANGTGVAFVDYDNDGWQDIFLVNGSTLDSKLDGKTGGNRLYKNQHDGTFADVTSTARLSRTGWGNGVCAGDINNDGYTDLFVTYWGANALYVNNGKGSFEETAVQAGVAGTGKQWSSGCTFIDYDRDGKLDLFVTRYQEFDLAGAPLPGKLPIVNGKVCRCFVDRAACRSEARRCITTAATGPLKM